MSLRLFAPAKINLTLQVGRARADGRHPLQSVVAFADVGDWLEAAPADTLTLTIGGPFAAELADDESNLVLRAARALAAEAALSSPGAALTLTKNLPVASGIGGGSSDAAAALKALNALWALRFSPARLEHVAQQLGGDVPVCVQTRPAYMRGAGEDVAPLDLPLLHGVLVNPLEKLATADVYREFDVMGLGGAFAEQPAPRWRDPAAAIAGMRALGNDLAAPALRLLGVLQQMTRALQAHERVLYAALSGSGATMFALTETAADAAAAAEELKASHPHWWVAPARLGGLDGNAGAD